VLRLNRFFWSDGEAGMRRYLGLARRFARRGFLIELQVRYHPDAEQEGDLPAWREHVREVVRRFGRIGAVIALQIANEVNIAFCAEQARRLRNMVRAVHDYRGTFGVTDYRWFNLRDADSSAAALFQHFGLLESDYDGKPAFGAYRALVRRLGGTARVRP
jgi:hypothetical protein